MVMPDQPGETTDGTTAYSADNLGDGQLRIVGTYSNTGAAAELGFLFTGTVDDVADAGSYVSLPFPTPSATWNVPHSTSGGLVVGNYDSSTSGGLPAGGGRAYVYDAVSGTYLVPSMVYPDSAATTAYGIWHNGGTNYTIAGGYANSPINNLLNPNQPLSKALLVDFDSATGQFSNWKSYTYTPPSGGGRGSRTSRVSAASSPGSTRSPPRRSSTARRSPDSSRSIAMLMARSARCSGPTSRPPWPEARPSPTPCTATRWWASIPRVPA